MTAEQVKQIQEQQAQASKEKDTVKTLNDKLNAAKTASDAGDFETAVATLTEATQVDPTRDLVWFKLGEAYRNSAPKQTDPAEKQNLAPGTSKSAIWTISKPGTYTFTCRKPGHWKAGMHNTFTVG